MPRKSCAAQTDPVPVQAMGLVAVPVPDMPPPAAPDAPSVPDVPDVQPAPDHGRMMMGELPAPPAPTMGSVTMGRPARVRTH